MIYVLRFLVLRFSQLRLCTLGFVLASASFSAHASKVPIEALYIPLADHYAALVAHHRYRDRMQHANFSLEQMPNWDLLRARFQEGRTDMAFVMTPLALDMYTERPHFRWIGLMHRDGNALAINERLNHYVQLPAQRRDRIPNDQVAKALKRAHQERQRATEIAVPHLLSTHTVVLYRYLKEHGLRLDYDTSEDAEVVVVATPPSQSPAFLKSSSNRAKFAGFEQSLPWADVVETQNFGKVAWYSKDVMPWPKGHVECIAIASIKTIEQKQAALKEVMHYIRLAGHDIERARLVGGKQLDAIVDIVQTYIPEHTKPAIKASLSAELDVINYTDLGVDKAGLQQIMGYALEAGILKQPVDIDRFADERFASDRTFAPVTE
ncbi:MAG: ABC transporter substrate-binding protein [Pontibacterium sp.]